MKKFLPKFAASFLLFSTTLYALLFSTALHAQGATQYPNITGNVLFQIEADRVLSSQKTGVSPNNAFVYIEPNFGLNFNKNWSVKTDWRIQPNQVLTTRDPEHPERYRTFLAQNRGVTLDNGLIIEEIKLQFQNEDMRFVAGKFDPTFGTAYNKAKRIGVFTSQFAEDYNLREKIGGSMTALLEKSKITVNSFFNDTTGLSGSALGNRQKASTRTGIAGSTNTLASYSVSMDGKDFFGIEDWTYNLGFKSLSVVRLPGRQREKGYVFGSEYLYHIGDTAVIPFMEIVKISSLSGEQGRNATYTTTALIGKYSSWTGSISYLARTIKSHQSSEGIKKSDQLQLSVGYKFTNNITLDATRSNMKEDGNKASLLGVLVSYLYQF